MKHLLFTPVIPIPHESSVSIMVDYIEAINNELRNRGYSMLVIPPVASSPVAAAVRGPLEHFWLKLRGVSRVRRTEGRSSEEQAEYNLRHYQSFNDEQIQKIIDAALPEETGTIIADEDEAEIPEHQLF